MAKKTEGLFDLLQKQHKFGAQNGVLESVVQHKNGNRNNIEEVESVVKSILVSGQSYRVSELIKDYRGLTGQPFPARELGFYSAVDLLKTLTKACEVLEDGTQDPVLKVIGTEKTIHIQKLIQKSRPKSKVGKKGTKKRELLKDVFVPFHVQDGIRRILFDTKTNLKPEVLYEKLLLKYDLKDMGLDDVPINILAQSVPHLMKYDGRYVLSQYKIEESEIKVPKSLHFIDEVIIPSYRLSKIEQQISENILKMLDSVKFLKVEEIPKLYYNKFGRRLDWIRLGFRDLWKFLVLLPGNFKLVRTGNRFVILRSDDKTHLCDLRERDASMFSGVAIWNRVFKEIEELAKQMNTGFSLSYLETSYEAFYHRKLVLQTDVLQFARVLHDVKVFTLRTENGKSMIYPFSEGDTEERNLRFIDQPALVSKFEYPEGVMIPGDNLLQVEFPKVMSAKNPTLCSVYVTAVTNPSNFYIKIIGIGEELKGEYDLKFGIMNTKMQKFYKLNYKQFKIPLAQVRVNMICTGCICGVWQRVCIMDFTGPKGFVVRSVDFGSVHILRLGSLCYLKKEFSSLPILAYKATLFDLRPPNCFWTVNARQDFLRVTGEGYRRKPLIAYIVIRNEDNILNVTLTDVSNQEDRHIGEQLIKLKHAEYKLSLVKYHDLFS